jgi:hypothetical protein
MVRKVRCGLFLAAAAVVALGGCQSSEVTGLCSPLTTAEATNFHFSASPNSSAAVVTSPNAMKACTAKLDIRVRYEDEERSRATAPKNILVEFGVEDATTNPPTLFPPGKPVYTTQYYRKFIEWSVLVNASQREEPVQYFIVIRTEESGDDPVLVDAVIRYSAY